MTKARLDLIRRKSGNPAEENPRDSDDTRSFPSLPLHPRSDVEGEVRLVEEVLSFGSGARSDQGIAYPWVVVTIRQ